ncbi:class XI myosin MyoE [Volvox carteri f. nagariensis]|uniref:Class XI myosin MyoE n=1 Tax=Volvox carteri f. nagariensis TaxID=3068 RepID=D8TV68_VOLCA|nr:class XI myosin MyoE [Volvox carteri f. nagariensis]EFJ48524.1 class XI myosin MyoE [Volvox carteri f. nagariensis]|eukprot:XP_002950323.1 class XI myosin MyoE [Volvox carteri f. nagariensis]
MPAWVSAPWRKPPMHCKRINSALKKPKLIYRCCLRWGCFTGDSQASAILDNLSALLLAATDEDAILARTTALARARVAGTGTSSGGGGEEGRSGTILPSVSEEEGAQVEQVAVAAATREVAYWLAVTSVLLALIDPHLPVTCLSRTAPGAAAADGGAGIHLPAPLAVVAGDARASMARAASAAAAKVQELQKRMGNTISGMQLLGKNLLMRRRGKGGEGGAAAQQPSGAVKPEGGDVGHLEQVLEQGAGTQEPEAAAAAGEVHVETSPSTITINVSEGPGSLPPMPAGSTSTIRSSSPSAGAMEPAAGLSVRSSSPAPPPVTASAALHPVQVTFRQQLDFLVQKAYVQMRDSLKRHVSAVLPGCVQQPVLPSSPWNSPARREGHLSGSGATEQQEGAAGGTRPSSGQPAAAEGGSMSGSGGGVALSSTSHGSQGSSPQQPWLDLISVLSSHLALLREAHVPRILIRCLYKQVVVGMGDGTVTFVDVQLFNQLLLRPECCSTSNARYLVEGLQLLDTWLTGCRATAQSGAAAAAAGAAAGRGQEAPGQGHLPGRAGTGPVVVAAGEELAMLVEDLRHIRQAAHFLILANKGALRLDDFITMCPALNVQQLYRLATTFWDDSPPPLPPPAATAQSAVLLAATEADAGGGGPAAEAAVNGADATSGEGEQDVVEGGGAAVLEEMKRRHSVANNGGLIVTFLLDEDSVPLIVQGTGGGGGGGGVVARQLLQVINEPRLHEGLTEGLPPALRSEDCPPQAFAFMIDDGGATSASSAGGASNA